MEEWSGDYSSTEEEEVGWSDEDDDKDEMGRWRDLARDLVDVRSKNFQPGLALNLDLDKNKDLIPHVIPDPKAPKYLNIAAYDKAVGSPSKEPDRKFELGALQPLRNVKKLQLGGEPAKVSAGPGPVATTSTATASTSTTFPIPGRRFLPHQLPVYKPQREKFDVLKEMERAEGPLAALKVAMEAEKRVRVWTRRDFGIRGYLTGFVQVFDRHWNLGLRDVDELFCRPRRVKGVSVKADEVEEDSKKSPRKSRKSKTAQLSPTKRSKRIAARSTSRNRVRQWDGVVTPDNSEELVSWCRTKLENISLKDAPSLVSKSHSRKHGVTLFAKPERDADGFLVIGTTKRLEFVERHVGQLFVMGNDIVFIETTSR